MAQIPPFSTFYVKSYTATADGVFRIEDNLNIVLDSCNIHVYGNDALYGNSMAVPGIVTANSTIWFDSPIRPFDLMFQNRVAGNNTTIVIIGAVKP
jgi:hypothetical protein